MKKRILIGLLIMLIIEIICALFYYFRAYFIETERLIKLIDRQNILTLIQVLGVAFFIYFIINIVSYFMIEIGQKNTVRGMNVFFTVSSCIGILIGFISSFNKYYLIVIVMVFLPVLIANIVWRNV